MVYCINDRCRAYTAYQLIAAVAYISVVRMVKSDAAWYGQLSGGGRAVVSSIGSRSAARACACAVAGKGAYNAGSINLAHYVVIKVRDVHISRIIRSYPLRRSK